MRNLYTCLPHHHRHILLQRPDQRNNPADHGPSEEQIQDKNGARIPLAPHQRGDGGKEVHQEPYPDEVGEEDEREMCECKEGHKSPPGGQSAPAIEYACEISIVPSNREHTSRMDVLPFIRQSGSFIPSPLSGC